jgi:serine O-acetyltransferase
MSKIVYFLISLRKSKLFGRMALILLKTLTLEIPMKVRIGDNLELKHLATGLVIHPNTTIHNNVQIFQGVTIGRADAYKPYSESKMESIVIKSGAVLCAGSKILCKEGELTVGENTIVGANSVLLNSTGDNEIWAGIPAKKVK